MNSDRFSFPERSFIFIFAVLFVLISTSGASAFFVEDASLIESPITAQPASIGGEWTGFVSAKDPTRIQLSFIRHTEKGGFYQSSEAIKMSDLEGLTADIGGTAKTDVSFKLVREAGTVSCEGFFQSGRGAGVWTFASNPSFVSAMASRGYSNLTDEDLLRAAIRNLTAKYADDIKAAGYDQLTFAQLLRAASHEITVAYIRELRDAGFENLTMDNVIRASNHDIDAAYMKEVAAMGFVNQPLESVIRLRNHEVTLDFVNQLRGEGFSNFSADTVVRLKNHDVDREFIQRARAQYPNASLDEMVRLKNRGSVK